MLGKARQLTARELAGRIAEMRRRRPPTSMSTTPRTTSAPTSPTRLGRIFDIRFELYQRKFVVKFLNNFLAQMTPFLFYLVGGYLAITGRLDIGALVAVIAAYKDLPGPIKELIDWDQQRQDVQIKYEQVIEQFQPEGMLADGAAAPSMRRATPLEGDIVARQPHVSPTKAARAWSRALGAKVDLTEHVAVVGGAGSGREALALGARRAWSSRRPAGRQHRRARPRRAAGDGHRPPLSYVGTEPYLFPLSVRENLLYGLQASAARGARTTTASAKRRRDIAVREAKRAGQSDASTSPPTGSTTRRPGSPTARGARGAPHRGAELVDLEEDVYQLGLRGRSIPPSGPNLADRDLEARADARAPAASIRSLPALVEPFDPRALQPEPVGRARTCCSARRSATSSTPENLPANAYRAPGARARRARPTTLSRMGRQIAETMVELFADLPPGHPFFEQFSFISADDLPEFRALLARRSARPAWAGSGRAARALMRAAVPLCRGAPPPRPDRRGDGGAPAGGAPRFAAEPAGGAARRASSSTTRALQRGRHAAGQHPVRPARLRPGAGRRSASAGSSPRCSISSACGTRWSRSGSTSRSASAASA